MDNKDKFEYTYRAPVKGEREEIEDIRNKYLPKVAEETKLQKLKKLDNKVNNIPTIYALCIGIIGLLIFGLGMTMVLEWNLLVWGVIVSVVGIVPIGIAYPIYRIVHNKLSIKYGEDIIKLSDELLNEDK